MEKCNKLMHREFLGRRETWGKSSSVLTKIQEENKQKMYSEEEEDSNWLFDVLESIGVNDEYRRTCQHAGITSEILLSVKALITSNFYGRSCGATVTQLHNDGCGKTSQKAAMICEIPDTFDNTVTWYNMGSAFEGTVTPDVPNDLDFIRCQEWPSVIQEIAKDEEDDKFSLLIVRDTKTPDGYVKLQLVKGKTPLTSAHRPSLKDNFPNMYPCFKKDKSKRLVLCDFLMTYDGKHMFSRQKNKPAVKHENYYGLNADNVISYRCKTWPSMANEWLTRLRVNDWPSKDMIQDMKSLGFFVVRKGHPFSLETDLEWRISLSLQERKLVNNLTNVQHKCYVFLKMINRDIINLECITSYHWKTCLFYLLEGNNEVIWEKQFLFHCVKLCIVQMLEWVECGVCPNYFIPAENLFDGRLTDSLRIISKRKLDGLLKDGFSFLLSVSSNNICDYVKSRNSITRPEWLQKKCEQAYITALYIAETSTFRIVHSVFNQIILPYYCKQTNDVHSNFLKFLWISKDRIQNISTITEHTAQEVQYGLDLLLPCFSTCLASNISALALSITKFDTRAFLLLGSLTYLSKGDLSSNLKLISVLLAAELYTDCEWHLDQLEKKIDFKCIPSFCVCRHIVSDSTMLSQNYINTSTVSTCLSFLPTELPIIPNALKYEMFRFIGTSIDEIHDTNRACHWHYMAVVDSNIYLFLLKYLLKKKLRKVTEYTQAKYNIMDLLHGNNVRHRDVAFNLLASICFSEFNTPDALTCLTYSWKIMISSDLCFMILTEEMKRKQYLYNAAKIHALVILYKTWFERLQPSVNFCFQCLSKSDTRLKQCSRCKVSTYCDKQCQRKNWKIHKKTCKMARKHHILFSRSVIPFADL